MSLPLEQARRALWRATLAYVLGWTAHTTFLFYLAPIALRLGGVEGRDLWIFSGTAVASMLAVIPAGRWADRHPRRHVLRAGLLFLAAAYAPLLVAPPGFAPTLAATFLTGTGLAALHVAFNSYVADLLAGPQMSEAYGRSGAYAILASALGPFLAAGIFALLEHDATALTASSLLFGLAALAAMLLTLGLPTVRPEIPIRPEPAHARRRAIGPAVLIYLFVGAGYGMTNPYFAVFFLDHLAMPRTTWGVLLSLGTLATAMGSLGAGMLTRRASPLRLVVAPQLGLALVSLLLALPLGAPLLGVVYVVRNLLSNTVAPMVSTLVMGRVAHGRAEAQGWGSLGWNAGWAVGALAGGVLLPRLGGGSFVVGALVGLVGVLGGAYWLTRRGAA